MIGSINYIDSLQIRLFSENTMSQGRRMSVSIKKGFSFFETFHVGVCCSSHTRDKNLSIWTKQCDLVSYIHNELRVNCVHLFNATHSHSNCSVRGFMFFTVAIFPATFPFFWFLFAGYHLNEIFLNTRTELYSILQRCICSCAQGKLWTCRCRRLACGATGSNAPVIIYY